MNKEQQELLDEVYKNYETIHKHAIRTEGDRNQFAIESLEKQLIYPQEEFINKCKTDPEFSETWGLKIYTKVDGDKVWMGMVYNDNAVEIRLK